MNFSVISNKQPESVTEQYKKKVEKLEWNLERKKNRDNVCHAATARISQYRQLFHVCVSLIIIVSILFSFRLFLFPSLQFSN